MSVAAAVVVAGGLLARTDIYRRSNRAYTRAMPRIRFIRSVTASRTHTRANINALACTPIQAPHMYGYQYCIRMHRQSETHTRTACAKSTCVVDRFLCWLYDARVSVLLSTFVGATVGIKCVNPVLFPGVVRIIYMRFALEPDSYPPNAHNVPWRCLPYTMQRTQYIVRASVICTFALFHRIILPMSARRPGYKCDAASPYRVDITR